MPLDSTPLASFQLPSGMAYLDMSDGQRRTVAALREHAEEISVRIVTTLDDAPQRLLREMPVIEGQELAIRQFVTDSVKAIREEYAESKNEAVEIWLGYNDAGLPENLRSESGRLTSGGYVAVMPVAAAQGIHSTGNATADVHDAAANILGRDAHFMMVANRVSEAESIDREEERYVNQETALTEQQAQQYQVAVIKAQIHARNTLAAAAGQSAEVLADLQKLIGSMGNLAARLGNYTDKKAGVQESKDIRTEISNIIKMMENQNDPVIAAALQVSLNNLLKVRDGIEGIRPANDNKVTLRTAAKNGVTVDAKATVKGATPATAKTAAIGKTGNVVDARAAFRQAGAAVADRAPRGAAQIISLAARTQAQTATVVATLSAATLTPASPAIPAMAARAAIVNMPAPTLSFATPASSPISSSVSSPVMPVISGVTVETPRAQESYIAPVVAATTQAPAVSEAPQQPAQQQQQAEQKVEQKAEPQKNEPQKNEPPAAAQKPEEKKEEKKLEQKPELLLQPVLPKELPGPQPVDLKLPTPPVVQPVVQLEPRQLDPVSPPIVQPGPRQPDLIVQPTPVELKERIAPVPESKAEVVTPTQPDNKPIGGGRSDPIIIPTITPTESPKPEPKEQPIGGPINLKEAAEEMCKGCNGKKGCCPVEMKVDKDDAAAYRAEQATKRAEKLAAKQAQPSLNAA